jgi:hypothetical protein
VQVRGHAIGDGEDLDVALPSHRELAVAVLRGLHGPYGGSTRVGLGIGPKYCATSASAFASSNLPATSSTALSGW